MGCFAGVTNLLKVLVIGIPFDLVVVLEIGIDARPTFRDNIVEVF
jgi:hypothetical protein